MTGEIPGFLGARIVVTEHVERDRIYFIRDDLFGPRLVVGRLSRWGRARRFVRRRLRRQTLIDQIHP